MVFLFSMQVDKDFWKYDKKKSFGDQVSKLD
jgi:hypothetical protein